jgi:hypothetical protein
VSTEATLTLVFSGLVALSTVVYAVLTAALVTETRRMRRTQTDAKIGISVEPSQYAFGFADLLIRNYGAGAATDVRFEILETEAGKGDADILKALRSFGFIEKGLDYMPPGFEYRTYLVSLIGKREDIPDTYVHLRVKYRSPSGEQHLDCYPVNLAHFWNRMRLGTPHFEAIAKELEHIRKILEAIAAK